MIYYFSGTGNSEWVAKSLAEQTGDSCTRITLDTQLPVTVHRGETFGLVFPVYAWNMPAMVSDFLKNVCVEAGAYTYAVCTCGAEAGYTMRVLKARMHMDCCWSLIMPDSYIVAFQAEEETQALAKVRTAAAQLPQIAEHIRARDTGCYEVTVGSFPFLKTFVGSHLFNKYARSAKPFHTSYDCTGCGVCEKFCPTKNIVLADGMPFWDENCQQCLGCIQRCPKKAIDYGKSTKKHGRYVFHYTKEQIEGENSEV